MAQENQDGDLISRYLLGRLQEDELEQLEERMMVDSELFDQVLLAEDEMVEAYVNGDVPESDVADFRASFLSTPEGKQQYAYAEALRKHVDGFPPSSDVIEPVRDGRVANEQAPEIPATEVHQAEGPVALGDAPSNHVQSPRQVWWRRPALAPYLAAAAAVIVIGVGLGIREIIAPSEASRGSKTLAYAYRDQRPIEARISGFDYAPASTTRGGEPKVDKTARNLAESILLDAVLKHPNAATHHAAGRLYLAEKKLDEAIEQFEEALKSDPNNAQLHSDFGAAYLEKASIDAGNRSLGDLAKSLEQFDQAMGLDAALLEAQFNKALCLQRMGASAAAREAWESYLRNDSSSEWSREAQTNLRLLQERGQGGRDSNEVVTDFLASYRERDENRAWLIQSQTKEMITGMMVPFELARKVVDANLANRIGASTELLRALQFAGDLEMRKTGDPFFAELGGFYSASGRWNADSLKHAQDAVAQAYKLCSQGRYSEASEQFEEARRIFVLTGDTWESKVVDYWLAYCFSQRGELKRSSDLLLALLPVCANRRYRWLEAQSYAWLANNNALLGEYSLGAEQDRRALDIALAIGDAYNIQKTSSQLAEDYKFFGRLDEALELNQQSLPLADAYYVSARQLWRGLNSVTDTLFALSRFAAAEAYEREALQLATTQFDDPVLAHNTYVRLGQIYAGQQKYAAAVESLQLSLRTIRAIKDEHTSRKLSGQSNFQMGSANRQAGDVVAALKCYQEAAQKFNSTEFALYNYIAHKGMLLCYLLNQDDAAVEREMPAVLDLFEQSRRKIKEEQNRNHFFDSEQSVYDLAIDYQWSRDIARSFYYAELSRARSLLDALAGADISSDDSASADMSAVSQPLSLTRLQEQLPPNSQVVEYAVLEKRLLIWIISKTQVQAVDVPAPAATLETRIGEYLEVLAGRDTSSVEREKQLASQLYDWLYAPVERYLNKSEVVAIIPDKFLFKVPFSALLSRSGRRVVSDYTLLYAPSATVLTVCTDLARTKEQNQEDERVLGVGDPTIDRREHRDLGEIPSAGLEARKIGSLYRTFSVFTDSGALKQVIVAQLPQADVIHFATHYIADSFSAENSRLLLAATKTEGSSNAKSDDLSLRDIQAMRLPRAKLAILSTCQSGIERYYAGEGLIGLSRAFMVARVPLVVASQWAVESDSTARLMIDFHRYRKTGNRPTVEALRQAQLEMLNNEDERYRRPYCWAAFFPVGGHASY